MINCQIFDFIINKRQFNFEFCIFLKEYFTELKVDFLKYLT